MQETNPLISIITPVYNRESLVKISIESLLAQTYPYWEMLIVDDGSTDNTVTVIEEYTKKDNRIKLFLRDTPVKGGNVCRNIGLKNAKGEYTILLDSDDKLRNFCLQQRYEIASQYPEFDFWVFPGIRTLIDGDENDPDNFLISIYEGKENALDLFMNHDFLWQTTGPMYKTESLRKYKLSFDEAIKVHQDVLFHITALCRGMKFKIANESIPDYYWYVHDGGHTGTTVNKSLFDSNLIYLERIRTELQNANINPEKYNSFFLDFLLKDLARFGLYYKDKNIVNSIFNKIDKYDLLKKNHLDKLRSFCTFALLIPNRKMRQKLTTMYRLINFGQLPPQKYFLVKHLKEI